MEQEIEGDMGNMDKHGRPKKAVDWVALIDELWTSDDEDVPKARGHSSSDVKVSSAGSSESSEACVSEQDVKESRPHSRLEENSLETEQCPRSKVLKVVSEPTYTLEDPLTTGCPPCTNELSILKADQTSHRIRRTRQTDLLSFIDHKYSLANRSPLTDVENSTHSDSTDDGYMTSDNSRLDYTPQLSLPGIENETQHTRALFSRQSIRRYWKLFISLMH